MKKFYFILSIIILAAILSAPRLIGLDKFVSLDEPFWIREGANFYYALGQRQFEYTFYEYHPAVTTMWAITGGMLVYFPKYRALQQGYLTKKLFDAFLIKYGRTDLGVLLYSRLIQVLGIVTLLLMLFFLLRYLFGSRAAFFTTALISLSPFFLGYSRLLNHEAMMGLFILISLISLTIYLFKKRDLLLLILSATAGALAQLTKSSAFLLFPVIGLLLIFYLFELRNKFSWGAVLDALKILGIWVVVLVTAYFLFWPAMWVAPGQMFNEVYGNALSYALQGSRLSVSGGLIPGHLGLNSGSGTLGLIGMFVLEMLWHTTPISWIGFIVGIAILTIYRAEPSESVYKWMAVYLMVLAVLYMLMISVTRGQFSPHYILTSYVSVDLIAGLGLSILLEKMAVKWFERIREAAQWGILAVLLVIQAVFILGSYPYYYTYLNPLMELAPASAKNPIYDSPSYGEGLELAAAYLAQKPNASHMTVMSYCGYGCFSYFFPGTTLTINDVSLANPDPAIINYLHASEYAVLDHHLQKIQNDLSGFEGITPEKIIWINGVDTFDIYRTSDLLQRIEAGSQ